MRKNYLLDRIKMRLKKCKIINCWEKQFIKGRDFALGCKWSKRVKNTELNLEKFLLDYCIYYKNLA